MVFLPLKGFWDSLSLTVVSENEPLKVATCFMPAVGHVPLW